MIPGAQPLTYPANSQAQQPVDASRAAVEEKLVVPLTEGYKPSMPAWAYATENYIPQIWLYRDIELMMVHPVVRNSLTYFKSGVAAVEFELDCNVPEAEEFIMSQCSRYWDRGVPMLQGGYEYGWIGCEAVYSADDGPLSWERLVQFAPRDTFLLTQANTPVGVRVKSIIPQGEVNLWLATKDVPAKALWYAHEPRYHSHFGQSQLIAAWRPWRRLAAKDAIESVADSGMYRFAVPPVIVGYPDEDMQVSATASAPATSLDSQGKPRRYARDYARQCAEWLKSGAAIGFPTTKYPTDLGGGDKWTIDIPKSTLNIDGLIGYIKHLWDQINYGIGVPPELLQASEGGSGYSGRKIPREAFLMRQQRIADALLNLFVEQILKPLVRWNFGPHVKFKISVKNLLMTERKAEGGQEGQIAPQGGAQTPGSQITQTGQPQQPQQGPEPMLKPQGQQGQGGQQFSLDTSTAQLVKMVAEKITRRAA
jgi:hypothetical protein